MSKAKRFHFTEGQDCAVPARVARVQNLRRSSAAGPQDRQSPRRERSRSAARDAAIRRSVTA